MSETGFAGFACKKKNQAQRKVFRGTKSDFARSSETPTVTAHFLIKHNAQVVCGTTI